MKVCHFLIFLWMMCGVKVCAHPHSFIDINTSFITQDQKLIGFKMVWTMDEMTSADLLYDVATSDIDSEKWKQLAAEVMANVLQQNYFTKIYRNNSQVNYLKLPLDYHLHLHKQQAVLEFVVALSPPQPLHGGEFTVVTYDPTYFVDMTYNSKQAIDLSSTLSNQCQVTLIAPQPNDELRKYALSLDKADVPQDTSLGQQFAQKVILRCQ